jgi:hypothetical protein
VLSENFADIFEGVRILKGMSSELEIVGRLKKV